MKIQIFSDIHNEFGTYGPKETDSDIVILAGDIDTGCDGMNWALNTFPEKKVIYIAGNHEFYGESIHDNINKLKSLSKDSNVHFLNNETITIGNVRFLGCTLWTDLQLNNDLTSTKANVKREITDYLAIDLEGKKSLHPDDTITFHEESLAWLKSELNKEHNGKTVVVTHHAPCIESISMSRRELNTSPAYASNLETFVSDSGADIWVHGHTHNSSDYMLGSTRVICNPRGYTPYDLNKEFKSDLVIEV